MSINKKIFMPMIIISVVVVGFILFAIYHNVKVKFDAYYQEIVSQKGDSVEIELEDMQQRALSAVSWFGNSARLKNALQTNNYAEATELAYEAMRDFSLDYIVITDLQGNVLIRAYEPEKFVDSVVDQFTVPQVLNGEISVGIEKGLDTELSVRAGTPLSDANDRIIGTILAGYVISSEAFVDWLKAIINAEVTVFCGNERVMTTLVNSKGQRIIGTKLGIPAIEKKVLKQGERYYGKSVIQGMKYAAVYLPIKNAKGDIIGMFFVGEKADLISQLKAY